MPVGANVRTFHAGAKPGQPTDNHRIAAARVQLKLAALAYCETRHGADAGPGFTRAGLQALCQAAVIYTEALQGADAGELRELLERDRALIE